MTTEFDKALQQAQAKLRQQNRYNELTASKVDNALAQYQQLPDNLSTSQVFPEQNQPMPYVEDVGKLNDIIQGGKQGLNSLASFATQVADTAGNVLVHNPREIVTEGIANADIRLFEDGAVAQIAKDITGKSFDERHESLENQKSADYSKADSERERAMKNANGFIDTVWQGVKHTVTDPNLVISAIGSEAVQGGGIGLLAKMGKGTRLLDEADRVRSITNTAVGTETAMSSLVGRGSTVT